VCTLIILKKNDSKWQGVHLLSRACIFTSTHVRPMQEQAADSSPGSYIRGDTQPGNPGQRGTYAPSHSAAPIQTLGLPPRPRRCLPDTRSGRPCSCSACGPPALPPGSLGRVHTTSADSCLQPACGSKVFTATTHVAAKYSLQQRMYRRDCRLASRPDDEGF